MTIIDQKAKELFLLSIESRMRFVAVKGHSGIKEAMESFSPLLDVYTLAFTADSMKELLKELLQDFPDSKHICIHKTITMAKAIAQKGKKISQEELEKIREILQK